MACGAQQATTYHRGCCPRSRPCCSNARSMWWTQDDTIAASRGGGPSVVFFFFYSVVLGVLGLCLCPIINVFEAAYSLWKKRNVL